MTWRREQDWATVPCSLSSLCYIHSPATTSLDRAASSQVSPGLSCHKRASPPAHHLCQPWHRSQHLPPLKCRILILFDLFRSHWKLRDLKCRKKRECIQGSDHDSSIMDCTWPTILNNFWFSLSHTGLMLPLQITMLLLHVHDCLKTTRSYLSPKKFRNFISYLFNLVILADETHPTGLQLTQFISNLIWKKWKIEQQLKGKGLTKRTWVCWFFRLQFTSWIAFFTSASWAWTKENI